mgnify:CR=1 FL=1
MEIICYLSNGYPTIEASYNMAVEYADAGCRMMEVDFPEIHTWRVIILQEE